MKQTSSVRQSLFKVSSRTNCFYKGQRSSSSQANHICRNASVLTRLSVTALGPTAYISPQALESPSLHRPLVLRVRVAPVRSSGRQQNHAPHSGTVFRSELEQGGRLYMFWVDRAFRDELCHDPINAPEWSCVEVRG